ncbi:MAG TPA: hypothetical protein VGK18_09745 [Propionicimonas sp.]|jgi:hypothetical protein|uniref:hypothetical protein n=1 Tax=Propionicimonas sp. TaxID=1955623 RepID=UPI002F407012
MQLPDNYPDALTDELAPYGFEFAGVSADDEGGATVSFVAEPQSFVRANPGLGIEESYGTGWPPTHLRFQLSFDRFGDPFRIDFETIDLMSWAAAADPALHARLSTMSDPGDQAAAVGEALGAALQPDRSDAEEYLE